MNRKPDIADVEIVPVDPGPKPMLCANFWDVSTWEAQKLFRPVGANGIPQRTISTIRCQLGRVPVLPDLQPQADRAEHEIEALREARARAGFSGDCGDFFS